MKAERLPRYCHGDLQQAMGLAFLRDLTASAKRVPSISLGVIFSLFVADYLYHHQDKQPAISIEAFSSLSSSFSATELRFAKIFYIEKMR